MTSHPIDFDPDDTGTIPAMTVGQLLDCLAGWPRDAPISLLIAEPAKRVTIEVPLTGTVGDGIAVGLLGTMNSATRLPWTGGK